MMQKNEWIERARQQLRALVAEDLKDRDLSYRQISIRHSCTEKLVGSVAQECGLGRRTKEGMGISIKKPGGAVPDQD